MTTGGRPTMVELRRTFAAALRKARAGDGPSESADLDAETTAALVAIADAHPAPPLALVDAAHEAFSRLCRQLEREGHGDRTSFGPISWVGSTAYREGQMIGSVQRNDYELPRPGFEGSVRWDSGGSAYEAFVHGESIGHFGSEDEARRAVEDRF